MSAKSKKQRLKLIINHFSNGNNSEFARYIGVTPQAISSWLSRETFDTDLIYSKCVNISAHWLLTGEGEMLKPNISNPILQECTSESIQRDKEYIELQSKTIRLLEDQIFLLKEQNTSLKREIKYLASARITPSKDDAAVVSKQPTGSTHKRVKT